MPVTGFRASAWTVPMCGVSGKLKPATWAEAFAAIAAKIKDTTPAKMAAVVGDLAAAEEIKALKDLMAALRVTNIDCRQDGAQDRWRPAPDLSVQLHHRGRGSRRRHPAGGRQSALGCAGSQCPHPQGLAGQRCEGGQYRPRCGPDLSGASSWAPTSRCWSRSPMAATTSPRC